MATVTKLPELTEVQCGHKDLLMSMVKKYNCECKFKSKHHPFGLLIYGDVHYKGILVCKLDVMIAEGPLNLEAIEKEFIGHLKGNPFTRLLIKEI
jgi:hypothetical protein